jgi:hypothetical protein
LNDEPRLVEQGKRQAATPELPLQGSAGAT